MSLGLINMEMKLKQEILSGKQKVEELIRMENLQLRIMIKGSIK